MTTDHRTRTILFRGSCFVLALATALAVSQADDKDDAPPKIPAVGDEAPDFTLQTIEGDEVKLSALTEESPVVLVVLRGFPGYQCPICSAQVGALIGKACELADAEAKVVLVYPGPGENLTEKAQQFIRKAKLPENFYFVTDPDYGFTESYGLRWDAPRETAYPSTFVIDTDRIVRFAKVSKTHAGRANPKEVLEALAEKN